MMIERYKGIAGYVSSKLGRNVTEYAVKHAALRKRDPLPRISFNGRVAAVQKELDAWIERQMRHAA